MKFFDYLKTIFEYSDSRNMSEDSLENDLRMKSVISVVLFFAALVLTGMNIFKKYWFMASTTAFLALGFAIIFVLAYKFKARIPSSLLMTVLIAVTFTIYAITGENEGFAILWILLVPPIAMTILGLRLGLVLAAYFQLLLIVMFWTPLKSNFVSYFTATFMARFPVLYLTSGIVATLLYSQTLYYHRMTENMAYLDVLTGAYNRRYYYLIKTRITENSQYDGLSLISIDLNGLKRANDEHGHDAGDELIMAAVECMRKAFPDARAICRIGGDEFEIVTYTSAQKLYAQLHELENLCQQWHGKETSELSLSVGVASMSHDGIESVDELEQAADTSMYMSKSEYYIVHERRSDI